MFSKTTKKPGNDPLKAAGGGNRPGGSGGAPSIISADLRILGDILCDGDIQIEGVVEGDVKSKSLTVGESALVKGSVMCETARIRGTVDGEIFARTVFLARTSRVRGDITHESIAIEAGAYLDGRCRRLEEGEAELKAISPPAGAAEPALAVTGPKSEIP